MGVALCALGLCLDLDVVDLRVDGLVALLGVSVEIEVVELLSHRCFLFDVWQFDILFDALGKLAAHRPWFGSLVCGRWDWCYGHLRGSRVSCRCWLVAHL